MGEEQEKVGVTSGPLAALADPYESERGSIRRAAHAQRRPPVMSDCIPRCFTQHTERAAERAEGLWRDRTSACTETHTRAYTLYTHTLTHTHTLYTHLCTLTCITDTGLDIIVCVCVCV